MASDLKLLGFWGSPFVFRVVLALKLKGVDYEYIDEDLVNKSTRLLELNPVHKKVPVLVHEKKPIAESCVILEYIDETWQHDPLLPQDPYEKAIVRFWAKFADEKLLRSAWTSVWTKADERETALKEAIEAMEKLEGELKGKSYFGGESIGFLDIVLSWISYWVPVWEEVGSIQILNPEKFPAITAWKSKFLDHPVIKDSLPPRDKMIVHFHKLCKKKEIDAVLRELAGTD